MEIERKYFIETPPDDYAQHPFCQIEQAYLCASPVVRIRREDDSFYRTYKSKGLLSREEYNLPLDEASYLHLLEKADGRILKKRRYRIPLADTPYTIELDVFEGDYEGLILAEVEFPNEQEALSFTAPGWFSRDVTFSGEYQNSRLAMM